eukprot:287146_1
MASEFINNIKVGDHIDVFIDKINVADGIDVFSRFRWCVMLVESVTNNAVKVVHPTRDDYSQNIEKKPKYLAPLNTHTISTVDLSSSFKPYSKLSSGAEFPTNCPPIYDSKSNSILSAGYHELTKHIVIIQYDIAKNDTKMLNQILLNDNNMYPRRPIRAQTFDPQTRKFFIFIFSDKHELYIIVNIDTLEYDVKYIEKKEMVLKEALYTHSLFISSTNKCYIFDWDHHFEINDDGTVSEWIKNVTPNNDVRMYCDCDHKIIYVEKCKTLVKYYNCNCSNNSAKGLAIWYSDIEHKGEIIWNRYNSEINIDLSKYRIDYAVPCNNFLFFSMGNGYDKVILALDLIADKIFYDLPAKQISYMSNISLRHNHAIKSDNNDIHEISFFFGCQYKYSLYDIIPKEMRQFYLDKHRSLIRGFVKQTEKECKLTHNVSYCLCELTLLYFPSFI